MELNAQAIELNEAIKKNNPALLDMLSERGKAIFFPKLGILSQSAEAKGKKINATIGIAVEDDGTPMRLKSIAKNVKLSPNDIFSYAPSSGKPELRKKWREMIYQKNPSLKSEISSPVVTNALTHGLSMIGYLFADEDDKIISPDLYWENYDLIFQNAYGANLSLFQTFKGKGFNIDGLKEKLLGNNPSKKIVILNFPNNPSGYTPTEEEVDQIVQAIKQSADEGNKIIAIIDDAYFGLVYQNGIFKESIFARLADINENILAIKIDGATKEDYVWGFRVGFITYGIKGGNAQIYSALEAKTAGAIRGNISNAPNISQSLVYNAFSSPKYGKEKKQKYNLLKKRFLTVVKTLKDHPEYKESFEALPFNSGYFMCIRLEDGIDSEGIRKKLLEKYDTGIIANGSVIRIAFSALKKELIPELFDNIYRACKE